MSNYFNQPLFNPTGGAGMNPAMLGSLNQPPNKMPNFGAVGMNPGQAMNNMNNLNMGLGLGAMGGGMSGMNGMAGMNGMGNMSNLSMNGLGMNGAFNPQQLLQQPQQQQPQQQHQQAQQLSMANNPMAAMNPGMNMGMGMAMNPGQGINPANLMGMSASGLNMAMAQGGQNGMNMGAMGMNPANPNTMAMNGGFPTAANPMQGAQLHQQMLLSAGISRDQLAAMAPHDRQALMARMLSQNQQQQQQQQPQLVQQPQQPQLQAQLTGGQQQQPQAQQQQQPFGQNLDFGQPHMRSASAAGMNGLFDRPPSSMASVNSTMQAQSMNQPAQPSLSRPGTAQSHRPGTSLSHHSPTNSQNTQSISAPPMQNTMANDFMGVNGLNMAGIQGMPQNHQANMGLPNGFGAANPYPSTSPTFDGLNMNPPGPGSPHGVKRKLGMGLDSPAVGSTVPSGLNNAMGPPGLPRSMSNDPLMPNMGGDFGAQMNGFGLANQNAPPMARSRAPSAAGMSKDILSNSINFNPAASVASPTRQASIPPAVPGPPSPEKLTDGLPSVPAEVPATTATPAARASATPAPAQPHAPENSATAHLDRETTRVETVPAEDLRPLSPSETEHIKDWRRRDRQYQALLAKTNQRMAEELREATRIKWWERGGEPLTAKRTKFDVRYPTTKRPEPRDKKKPRREGLRMPRRLPPEQADVPERLVPIRIEFDVEHHKMRDTFIWNLNDTTVTAQNFAQTVVEDYGLASHYLNTIVKSIQEQLNDYKAHSFDYDADTGELITPDVGHPQMGSLDDKDASWWETWRKRLMSDYINGRRIKKAARTKKRKKSVIVVHSDVERPLAPEEISIDQKTASEDMRILIRLDIIVGNVSLQDQFEWDIDNSPESPERFAEVYARDLGLVGEFKTAIAHSIREQVQAYQKSLFIAGHPAEGSAALEEEMRNAFLPLVTYVARPQDMVASFTPQLNHMTESDIERAEKDRERDMTRRRKRQNRSKRGGALPDREPIGTHRTPAIGFPDPNPATLALQAAVNAPVSRRAAAAAASASIAHMVASENNDRFMSPPAPTPLQISAPSQPTAPVPVPKEKKAKGLFKAPDYDRPAVLRQRAFIGGPTPTTSMETEDTMAAPTVETSNNTTSNRASDNRSRPVTAKRAKELEREAKEKEFADGQHENIINGVWHCSNCGCPEHIAIGRRKGPLGDKSQCGTCGKYWHRHRKPRPVEYTTDPDYHLNLQRENDTGKSGSRNKKAKAPVNTATEAPSEPQTPQVTVTELPASPVAAPAAATIDRPGSAVSSVSSTSEPQPPPPLQANGSGDSLAPPVPNHAQHSVVTSERMPSNEHPLEEWLSAAKDEMQQRYPDDRFVIILRTASGLDPAGEWRVKCMDCPGKLYKPGPNETLDNFEVHLRNRQHRAKVNERLHRS